MNTLTKSQFTPDVLLDVLRNLPQTERYWISYSGGMDSHVLLHAICVLRDRHLISVRDCDDAVHAVHINHGLSTNAEKWEQHCEITCKQLAVSFHHVSVNANPPVGESPEAAARKARYQAISAFIQKGDCLLTAHHQDDQAETLLIQLLRGAGPHGLASMPLYTSFKDGLHARPLLTFTRNQLLAYAKQNGLRWINDETNLDTKVTRNFIRHDVLPVLRSRWPNVTKTLARSAKHCGDAAFLIDKQGLIDLQGLSTETKSVIDINKLMLLDDRRRRNVIRVWLRQLEFPLPSAIQLERLLNDALGGNNDSAASLCWQGVEIRRYRNFLFAQHSKSEFDSAIIMDWDMDDESELVLPDGRLTSSLVYGQGISYETCQSGRISVRYRQGGEKCKLPAQRFSKRLKQLFQEKGIPPWQRDRTPLLFVGEKLAAVIGLCICEPFVAGADEPGLVVTWVQNSR